MVAANFVVEDGTGLNDANSYNDVADCAQFHADSGNDYWNTIPVATQQLALVRATMYIEKRFAARFRGTRRQRTQTLSWPRLGAYDNDGFYIDAIPLQIIRAVNEYAMRAAFYNVLTPDVPRSVPGQDMTQNPAQNNTSVIDGQVVNKTTKIGPIETETTYRTKAEVFGGRMGNPTSRAGQSSVVNDFYIPEYPEADLFIEQILRSPFGAATLTRGD